MGDKYELLNITYSRYGFRDNRDCRYKVVVTMTTGNKMVYYYLKLPDLRKLIDINNVR